MALNVDVLKPTTIDAAVDRLLLILSEAELQQVRATPKDELFSLHFGLGISVRNAFGLHDPDNALVAACGQQADDVSMLIIEKFWLRLQVYKSC